MTQSVLVVLFDGVQPLDVAGPLDVFSVAARFAGTPACRSSRDVDRGTWTTVAT